MYQISVDVYRTMVGFWGSAFFCLLIYFLYKLNVSWINKGLTAVGQNTMQIYIVSSYINSLILPRITTTFAPNYMINLLVATVIIAVCMLVSLVCSKFPKTNQLLFGER